jgi:hypothetical protein
MMDAEKIFGGAGKTGKLPNKRRPRTYSALARHIFAGLTLNERAASEYSIPRYRVAGHLNDVATLGSATIKS